jgi:hypothetical protein
MILDSDALQPSDVINAGLCSRSLWSHVLLHIKRVTHSISPAWAGVPILCTGSWLRDLPHTLYKLYPAEKANEDRYRQHVGRWYGACPARDWNWNALSEVYEDYDPETEKYIQYGFNEVDGKSARQTLLDALTSALDGPNIPMSVQEGLWDDMLASFAVSAESGRQLVLRNLDAKEYFRLCVASMSSEHRIEIVVEDSEHLTLDQALLTRICWGSTNGSHEHEDRDWNLGRGKCEYLETLTG